MMFTETRLLDCVSYGTQFGSEFNTRITELKSGAERRNAEWDLPLHRYAVQYQALTPELSKAVRDAHMACRGRLIGFRFKDWTDYRAEAEPLGMGTGVEQTLQLIKTYSFGTIDFTRKISKPVAGSVTVFANGIPSAVAVDYTTGLVTVTASPGDVLTWSGEFDVPVRFDADRLDVEPLARRQDGFILSSDADLTEIRL
jgi:uncharacterized protein (TIGR02217 family)